MNPRELKAHHLNKHIYGMESVDEGLVESIKEHGLLEKLVIKEDGTIISGHRRWRAILELYPEHIMNVHCEVVGFNHDEEGQLEEELHLLEYNRQRKKTKEQLAKEGEILESIYAKQAQKRKLANLKQNQDEDRGGQLAPSEDIGRTTEKVANELGISERSYKRLKKVRESTQSEDPIEAKIATENLQNEEKSIHRSYEELKEFKYIKQCSKDLNPRIAEKAKAMLERIDSAEKVHGNYYALKFTVDKERDIERDLKDAYSSDDYESGSEYIENEEDIKDNSFNEVMNPILNAKPVNDSPKHIFKKKPVMSEEEAAVEIPKPYPCNDECDTCRIDPEYCKKESGPRGIENNIVINETLKKVEEAGKEIKKAKEDAKTDSAYIEWKRIQQLEMACLDIKKALKILTCPVCGSGPESLKWTCHDLTLKESVETYQDKYAKTNLKTIREEMEAKEGGKVET